MTSFEFIAFILGFVPVTMLAYQLTKKEYRWIVLLIFSFIFILINSGKLAVFIILSAISIYLCGLWMDSIKSKLKLKLEQIPQSEKKTQKKKYQNKQKAILALAVIFNLSIIVILKYSAFISENLNILFQKTNADISLAVNHYALPIGLSFYSLSAISYITDVYRGTIKAERNVGKITLFLSFFPQIMEGPICRYSDTSYQLKEGKSLCYDNICFGFQRIGFGMAKRMLIADRVNNFVNSCFSGYIDRDGALLIIGSVLYTFQLYMDFSGTMDIVIGTGEIFGIKLPENFRRPFFSQTISEFWKRWHITLGTFFADYVFYPISMSKPMMRLTKKLKKVFGNYYSLTISSSVALMVVWFCNGIWHGSGWQYLFFGLYSFTVIFIGNIIEMPVQKLFDSIKLNRQSLVFKLFRIIRTAFLFNLGEIFFRSSDLSSAFGYINQIIHNTTFDEMNIRYFRMLGLDYHDFVLIGLTLAVLIFIAILEEKDVNIRKEISGFKPVYRVSIYVALIAVILVFGGYGYGYTFIDPIYAKF